MKPLRHDEPLWGSSPRRALLGYVFKARRTTLGFSPRRALLGYVFKARRTTLGFSPRRALLGYVFKARRTTLGFVPQTGPFGIRFNLFRWKLVTFHFPWFIFSNVHKKKVIDKNFIKSGYAAVRQCGVNLDKNSQRMWENHWQCVFYYFKKFDELSRCCMRS